METRRETLKFSFYIWLLRVPVCESDSIDRTGSRQGLPIEKQGLSACVEKRATSQRVVCVAPACHAFSHAFAMHSVVLREKFLRHFYSNNTVGTAKIRTNSLV